MMVRVYAIIFCLLFAHGSFANAGGFYDGADKYRGFYWFEQSDKKKEQAPVKEFHYPTPEEAARAIEERKATLDAARSQMVELGFRKDVPPAILRQAIVKYKKLEVEMYDGAIRLVEASELANMTNPEIADVRENPTNVFANKIKRAEDEKNRLRKVKQFSTKFDLVLFSDSSCPYCQAFEPVASNFAKTHSFALDISDLGSEAGKIAQKLGVSAVPTLIAVSKDGKQLFEITRGMSSLSDLESSILLAKILSEEQNQQTVSTQRKR